MLFKISLLTSLLFSAIYPLCFWISFRDPLKNNFHHFHLGVSCLVAGLATIVYWVSPTAVPELRYPLVIWAVGLLLVSAGYWKKPTANPVAMIIIFAVGMFAIVKIMNTWLPVTPIAIFMTVLGGLIFCTSLFAMNLGHWYLNVHGLPLKHLKLATSVFWMLCTARAVLDIYLLLTQTVMFRWETLSVLQFIFTIEGFLLVLAILFGTIFPMVCLYFVKGTLDVKSTQSATGILYAILCGVVIGDITYKYYFLKYGIVL